MNEVFVDESMPTGLEPEPDWADRMVKRAGTGPFPTVRRPSVEPFDLSDCGLWDKLGEHDPKQVVHKNTYVDGDKFLKTTGLESSEPLSELGERQPRPLEKRASATPNKAYDENVLNVLSSALAVLRKLTPPPAEDKKVKFKPGQSCRLRAGGARCTVVDQRASGLVEVALVGGGSAYVTCDQLEPE